MDITNPQTWNRYAYVGNNPLNAVDPLGLHDALDCMGGPLTCASAGGGGGGGPCVGCGSYGNGNGSGLWWGPGEFDLMTLPVYDANSPFQLSSTSTAITYDPNQIGYPDDQPQTITTEMVGLSYAVVPNSTGLLAGLGNNSAYFTSGGTAQTTGLFRGSKMD